MKHIGQWFYEGQEVNFLVKYQDERLETKGLIFKFMCDEPRNPDRAASRYIERKLAELGFDFSVISDPVHDDDLKEAVEDFFGAIQLA